MARDERPAWHPILAAQEFPVGTWRMIDTLEREYGVIRLVRLDGEPQYRCEFRGELLGYANSLRFACERVQLAFVQSGQPGGFAPSPWPASQG